MTVQRAIGISPLLLVLAFPGFARGEPTGRTISLVIDAGRPLQVGLDERVTVKRVGQPITGVLIEPVYAYDRVVVPAGTKVLGHVARIDGPSRLNRMRALLNGDLTPASHLVLQFDMLMLDTGEQLTIHTIVTGEIPRLARTTAAAPASEASESQERGAAARAREEGKNRAKEAVSAAKQKARDALSALSQPGKMERLKQAVLQRLPYHRQVLSKGIVYQAELVVPVEFGTTTPVVAALPGTRPTPGSFLNARLATTLDSSKTSRGTPIEAVVTEPVYSADHQLIYPEGTRLKGEVTFAKAARRFHRNGQLRFLFETVQAPSDEETQEEAPLLASLHAVQANAGDHVAIDEEGGATLSNSKTRFIAPALAVLALGANAGHEHHKYDGDGDANDVAGPAGITKPTGNIGTRGLGGFLGLGVLGIVISQISRPVGVALSVVGIGRTVYSNVLGKGREVRFPADTSMQLQLAPGPTSSP